MPVLVKGPSYTALSLDDVSVKKDAQWVNPQNIYVKHNGYWEYLYGPTVCGGELTGTTTLPMDVTTASGPLAYSCVTFVTITSGIAIGDGARDQVVIEQNNQVVFDTGVKVATYLEHGRGNIGIPVQNAADEQIRIYNPNANSYWLNVVRCSIDWDSTQFFTNFNKDFTYVGEHTAKCFDSGVYDTNKTGSAKPIYHVDPSQSATEVKAGSCSVLTNMAHTESGVISFEFYSTESNTHLELHILDSSGTWITRFTTTEVPGVWSEYNQETFTQTKLSGSVSIAPGPIFCLLFAVNSEQTDRNISVVGRMFENGVNILVTDFTWKSSYYVFRSGNVESQALLNESPARIFKTFSQATSYVQTTGAPTMFDIFNTWPRLNAAAYYANKDSAAGDSADWYYDDTNDRFVMPTNSNFDQAILSPGTSSSFEFAATVTSPDADDDAIGLVIAFKSVGNIRHTLIAIRTQGGVNPVSGFGILYIVNGGGTRTEYLIEDESVGGIFTGRTGGWRGRFCRIRIVRSSTSATIQVGDWDSPTYQATFTVDFVSGVSTADNQSVVDLSVFSGATQYGFYNRSQSGSTYYDVTFPASSNSASSYVYAIDTNTLWDGTSGTWVRHDSTHASDFMEHNVLYTNDQDEQFYVYRKGVMEV